MFCVSENKENIPYVYVNIAAFRTRNVESRKRVVDQSEFSTGVKWIIKHQTVWRILRTKINVESQPTNLRSCFPEIFISLVCYHVTWRPCWMTTQCNFCCAEFAWTRFKFPQKPKINELISMSRAWDKEKNLSAPTGLEPMTSQTPGERSIHLSYGEFMESEFCNQTWLPWGQLQNLT